MKAEKSPGPHMGIRWLAFIGWLTVPIVVTWMIVTPLIIDVLWWGPIWFVVALIYMIGYFTWVRRRYPKE